MISCHKSPNHNLVLTTDKKLCVSVGFGVRASAFYTKQLNSNKTMSSKLFINILSKLSPISIQNPL